MHMKQLQEPVVSKNRISSGVIKRDFKQADDIFYQKNWLDAGSHQNRVQSGKDFQQFDPNQTASFRMAKPVQNYLDPTAEKDIDPQPTQAKSAKPITPNYSSKKRCRESQEQNPSTIMKISKVKQSVSSKRQSTGPSLMEQNRFSVM